jgi:hypothetical protein
MKNQNEQPGNDVNVIQTNGSCHCGKIEYAVKGPILGQSYCDCKACQKATGALKVPFITVHKDNIDVTTGDPSEVHGNTDGKCDLHGTWQFCDDCGTKMFWVPDRGEQIDILVGALDDKSVFREKT